MGGVINIKINSQTKYVLLYGEEGVGKTLLQYCIQSNLSDFDKIEETKGVNYEEVEVKGVNLGIFDCSGNIIQYEIVDIITKCVAIEIIIFIISLEKIDELNKAKDRLKMIINNKHLSKGISLLVIYNKKSNMADKFWMDENLLDDRMSLKKIAEKYKLKYVKSIISDVYVNNFKESKIYLTLEEFIQAISE